jgi:hypothetical protein
MVAAGELKEIDKTMPKKKEADGTVPADVAPVQAPIEQIE